MPQKELKAIEEVGYLVGPPGESVCCLMLDHDSLIAIFKELLKDEVLTEHYSQDNTNLLYAKDSIKGTLMVLETIAWRKGLCSFDKEHNPIPFHPDKPFYDER